MNVAVVGAGIAGLAAAWRLRQAGHEVTVHEAAPAVGGRMSSTRAGGFPVDLGAHMLLDSYDRTKALSWEVGLGEAWYPLEGGEGGGVVQDDTILPFSPASAFDALAVRGLPLGQRLRLFAALARGWSLRDDLDFFDLSTGPEELDVEDCESFARRTLGDEATDYVVDAFIRTFHFHGAGRMSRMYFEAAAALLAARGAFELVAIEGHMAALPEALAARLDVVRSRPITAVEPGRVRWAQGHADVDAVVVATTAGAARRLLVDPTAAQASVLADASYAATAVVDLLVPVDVAHSFQGVWIPYRESGVISGLSNESAKGARDARSCVFAACLHDEAASTLLRGSDADLARAVVDEIVRIFPRYAGHLQPLRVQRWPEAMPVYAPGRITSVRRFWEDGQGDGGIWLCGDWLNHPWVEGAVRCGEKVAARIDAAGR